MDSLRMWFRRMACRVNGHVWDPMVRKNGVWVCNRCQRAMIVDLLGGGR